MWQHTSSASNTGTPLVPEHVADRALAHACGAGHGVKKDLNFAPFHIASQRSSTVTHLCFQSAPEAGASWSRTSRHNYIQPQIPSSLGDHCIGRMWQWAPQIWSVT